MLGGNLIGLDAFVSLETNATTTEGNSTVDVQFIVRLVNDGNDNIKFAFDKPTTDASAFTLKPGEEIQMVQKSVQKLYYDANSGTQAFRFWGIK